MNTYIVVFISLRYFFFYYIWTFAIFCIWIVLWANDVLRLVNIIGWAWTDIRIQSLVLKAVNADWADRGHYNTDIPQSRIQKFVTVHCTPKIIHSFDKEGKRAEAMFKTSWFYKFSHFFPFFCYKFLVSLKNYAVTHKYEIFSSAPDFNQSRLLTDKNNRKLYNDL